MWAEAISLPDKSAGGVARFIFTLLVLNKILCIQMMCRMGCPEVIITDQGREFVNSELNEIPRTSWQSSTIKALALLHGLPS